MVPSPQRLVLGEVVAAAVSQKCPSPWRFLSLYLEKLANGGPFYEICVSLQDPYHSVSKEYRKGRERKKESEQTVQGPRLLHGNSLCWASLKACTVISPGWFEFQRN